MTSSSPYSPPSVTQGEKDQSRRVAGGVLLIFGVGIACWILSIVYSLMGGNTDLPILNRFMELAPEARSIDSPDGPWVIPQVWVDAVGYTVIVIFLSLIGGVMGVMMRWGAALLQADINFLIDQLTKKIAQKVVRGSSPLKDSAGES